MQALAQARQLALLFPSVRLTSAPVLAFVERVADELGEADVRELASSVEQELPFDGFRVASGLLAEACRQAREDVPFVRGVLTLVLLAYVRELELAPYIGSRN